MNGIEQGWPQRVSFTSLVRVTKVDLNKNIQIFLTFRGPCIVSIFLLIYFQRDATLHSLFISGKLFYMFWVVSPPIIRSTQLYLQYLVLIKPLLLPVAIVEELELG